MVRGEFALDIRPRHFEPSLDDLRLTVRRHKKILPLDRK